MEVDLVVRIRFIQEFGSDDAVVVDLLDGCCQILFLGLVVDEDIVLEELFES
jgi:hypothetical protein